MQLGYATPRTVPTEKDARCALDMNLIATDRYVRRFRVERMCVRGGDGSKRHVVVGRSVDDDSAATCSRY